MMSGIGLLSKSLEEKLRKAPAWRQRAAVLVACRWAVVKAGVKGGLVEQALESLRLEHAYAPELRGDISSLAGQLDDAYFDLKEAAEEANTGSMSYMQVFAQARALTALLYADPQDGAGGGDAIYEAAFASEDERKEELLALVEKELG